MSGAEGSARTGSTWTPRGTATWVRSRWATVRTGSASGGKSPADQAGSPRQAPGAAPGAELGVKSSSTYTVREAVDDWLRGGLDGTSDRTRTLYEGLLGPVLDAIGARPLRVLSAGDVRMALSKLSVPQNRAIVRHEVARVE